MRILKTALSSAAFVLMPVAAFAAGTPCEKLAATALPNAKVDMAKSVPAGDLTLPGGRGGQGQTFKDLPAFCRVAATLTPTSDSDIKIEVWLPANTWNGKFEAVGNGGWAGTISYGAMAEALKSGYATTSTDTGHASPGGAFVWGHPEKLADYSWRSEHEMTLKAKALVAAFYGDAPKYSYWNGCSTGGKQGLIEAARFPGDFDGMVTGDPANLQGYRNTWQVSVINQIHKDPAGVMERDKLAVLHRAALDACDAMDGVKDGLIENPKVCKFDPATTACKGGDTAACLNPAQIKSANILYSAGVANGKEYNPGLERGSEMGWTLWSVTTPNPQQSDFFKYLVYKDPEFDWKTLNPDAALPLAVKAAEDGSAEAKDLAKYLDKGGKIIMYQGWADPTVAPQATLNYYNAAMKASPKGPDSVRIFFVPGMGHCGGGEGATDHFDAVAPLASWVEKKVTPVSFVATNVTAGKVTRSRPLCAYPLQAHYKGTGSTDDAANFECKAP